MAFTKKTIHFLILYVLVLGVFVFALTSSLYSADEEWVCVQDVCVASEPAGEAWAQENCGEVETDDGEFIVACALVIDGVEQLVPIDTLNLSAIQVCTQYQCLQEVRVRPANYTFSP